MATLLPFLHSLTIRYPLPSLSILPELNSSPPSALSPQNRLLLTRRCREKPQSISKEISIVGERKLLLHILEQQCMLLDLKLLAFCLFFPKRIVWS